MRGGARVRPSLPLSMPLLPRSGLHCGLFTIALSRLASTSAATPTFVSAAVVSFFLHAFLTAKQQNEIPQASSRSAVG